MDKFDKLFKDKLGEITADDFDYKESSWERFHGKWEDTKEPFRKVAPLGWLKRNIATTIIILLLLISNIFFVKQFMTTRSDVKALSETVENLKGGIVSYQENLAFANEIKDKSRNQNSNESDARTTLNSNFNNSSATLKRSKFSFNNGNEFNQNTNRFPLITPNISNNDIDYNIGNHNIRNHNRRVLGIGESTTILADFSPKFRSKLEQENQQQSDLPIAVLNKEEIENIENENLPLLESASAKNLSNNSLNRLSLFLNNIDSSESKWWNAPKANIAGSQKNSFATKVLLVANASKPKNYQVGINTQFTGIPTVSNINPAFMTNYGLQGNALFYNRLRLNIGGNYWVQTYKYQNIQNLPDGILDPIISNFPMINPVNPLDELAKVEAYIYGFDIPISAQILLRPSKKWNPYLGFGMIGRYYNNYKLEYYFTDYTTYYEYEIKAEEKVSHFGFSMLQSQLGIDYQIYNHWLLNAELNYLNAYSNQPFGIPNIQQFGGLIGVKYQF